MGQIDILDRYPDFLNAIRQINNSEELQHICIKEEEMKGIYSGETRLSGFYDLDGKLCKMTLISLINSRVDSVDYYFLFDKLFYVLESSDLLTKNMEVVDAERKYSKYVFKGNRILDYERVGNYHNSFDKETMQKVIVADTLRNAGLLTKKLIEVQQIKN
jgi:hypothetical protein